MGGEEGKGFLMATGGLEIGRVNVAARGVGIARRALKESVAYAQMRKTMGKPIAEHQAIQLKLGEMAAKTRAAELLVEDAARAYDRGGRVDYEAGMAKWFATETALRGGHRGMRIFGANGYSKEYPIERLYRDAPLLIIGEGTNEMQRIIIARQLIARNPAPCSPPSKASASSRWSTMGPGPMAPSFWLNSARRSSRSRRPRWAVT